ncbi:MULTISPECIES: TetR/AcrR family transcriptional regulator [Carnobacterium]|uniref:TetR/AcrR family transcriptional regulator n=1 Tax=Carnobacterium TaxID=2747 RepID=UPI00214AEA03|nr:TetR/AcrR family transcriptional regulator [Carnobacterium maltaromaticum]
MNAAIYLVSQGGYKSATTKLIAEEALVNETTIFKNFKSKNALLAIAFEQHTNRIKEEATLFFLSDFENQQDLLRQTGYFIQRLFQKNRYLIVASIKEIGNKELDNFFRCRQEYVDLILSNKLREFHDKEQSEDQYYKTISFIFNNALIALLLKDIGYSSEEDHKKITVEDVIGIALLFLNTVDNKFMLDEKSSIKNIIRMEDI